VVSCDIDGKNMNGFAFFALSCLGGFGFLFFILGVLSRLGYLRFVYAAEGHLILTPPSFVFVFVLGGIIMMLLGFLPVLPITTEDKGSLVLYVLGPLLLLFYALAIWQPWWLKPVWLRWLEREHGDVIELLWEDVRKDRWGWERRVRTQAQLEAWVAEVRRKHGRDHLNAGSPFT
jgi:hypothetical protein